MIYDENEHNRVNIRSTCEYKITFVAETNDTRGYSRQILRGSLENILGQRRKVPQHGGRSGPLHRVILIKLDWRPPAARRGS